MRSTILLIILCLALTMVFAVSADAQNPTPPLQERNAAEEQPIYDKLSAIDPAAVPIFQQATADMDHNNLRITLGASRLQEILADRFAAMAYGTRNFVDGLTYVVRQSLLFDKQITLEVQQAAQHRRALHNLYTLPPLEPGPQAEELDSELKEVLSRPTLPYDSHPALQDRIHFLQRFDDSSSGSEGDQRSVWSLIPTADALQADMTHMVQVNVEQKYGLTLGAGALASDQ